MCSVTPTDVDQKSINEAIWDGEIACSLCNVNIERHADPPANSYR